MRPGSWRDDVSMTPRPIIVGLCMNCALALAGAPADAQIPFEADETSGPLKLTMYVLGKSSNGCPTRSKLLNS